MSSEKPRSILAVLKSIFSGSGKQPSSQGDVDSDAVSYLPEKMARQRDFFTIAPGVEMVFAHVPAGKFLMGTAPAQYPHNFAEEQPQHTVHLDAYWISKYPVTNQQYQVFVQATGHRAPTHWKNKAVSSLEEQHPVTYVSWHDAVAFCKWMSSTLGRPPVRLPTEAEWEKAARGEDGRIYPWGNEAPDVRRCNFELSVNGPSPVGKYSPQGDSPYGCADMAGNVWEWVSDWFDSNYYSISPDANPRGPSSGSMCVLRGGSFDNNLDYVRTAYRNQGSPDYLSRYLGFRVVTSSIPTLLDF
jgi:formylglycine-generating enzyme required for sulfatase activity